MSANTRESAALRFLYHTAAGRLLLRALCAPALSRAAGRFLDTRASRVLIGPFVRKNHINLSECESADFDSFNACFSRKLKSELRPVDGAPEHLIAPCDGLLSAYPIARDSVFPAKQSAYSVDALLGGAAEAARFEGGICLVFRLCVNHYHRYIWFDGGRETCRRKISGALHTVRPIALEQYPVFVQNARECTLFESEHFGLAAQIEIGAMLVGKIENHPPRPRVVRGEEKGMFRYGGSTIVLLLEPGRAAIDARILEAAARGEETPVRMGQAIGMRADKQEVEKHVC